MASCVGQKILTGTVRLAVRLILVSRQTRFRLVWSPFLCTRSDIALRNLYFSGFFSSKKFSFSDIARMSVSICRSKRNECPWRIIPSHDVWWIFGGYETAQKCWPFPFFLLFSSFVLTTFLVFSCVKFLLKLAPLDAIYSRPITAAVAVLNEGGDLQRLLPSTNKASKNKKVTFGHMVKSSDGSEVQMGTKHMTPPGGATSKRLDCPVSYWWRRLEVPSVLSPFECLCNNFLLIYFVFFLLF